MQAPAATAPSIHARTPKSDLVRCAALTCPSTQSLGGSRRSMLLTVSSVACPAAAKNSASWPAADSSACSCRHTNTQQVKLSSISGCTCHSEANRPHTDITHALGCSGCMPADCPFAVGWLAEDSSNLSRADTQQHCGCGPAASVRTCVCCCVTASSSVATLMRQATWAMSYTCTPLHKCAVCNCASSQHRYCERQQANMAALPQQSLTHGMRPGSQPTDGCQCFLAGGTTQKASKCGLFSGVNASAQM